MTLGSGVNIMKPSNALPPCFKFPEPTPDSQSGAGTYRVKIDIASSVAEIRSLRSRGGTVDASYGIMVSGSLSGWERNESTDKHASLFVVIEAQYTGPRRQAVNPVAKDDVKDLLDKGSADEIIRRCGTHLVTTEHRGQSLRVIIDTSQADTYSKQEMEAAFRAKAKFGLFGGGASGGYKSTLTRLASENKLAFLAEGTGLPPDAKALSELVRTKAGDLNAIGDALGKLLESTHAGNPSDNVVIGFTLQPISFFINGSSITVDDDEDQNIGDLTHLIGYLDDYKAMLRNRLVGGMSTSARESLDAEIAKYSAMGQQIRRDALLCMTGKSKAGPGCEAEALRWNREIRDGISVGAKFVKNGGGVYLSTDLPMRSNVSLIAVIDDQEIALDKLKVSAGQQLTALAVPSKAPTRANTPMMGMPAGGNIPPPDSMASSIPLTLSMSSLASVLQMKNAVPTIGSDVSAFVGCSGSYLYKQGGAEFSRTATLLDPRSAPDDSLCWAPSGVMTVGMMPAYDVTFPGEAPESIGRRLMPPGVEPLKISPVPSTPIALRIRVEDSLGFVSTHEITADLGQALQVLMDEKPSALSSKTPS